ncbi:MAG: UvrD-helicase domain-containing protein [Acidimicrobiales bacterium]|nr:UvrD-helicase domain-containing protein [Acidimicrobiales bacterium]
MSSSRFDPSGPVPGPGLTVLEASAGTGKTYHLTGLVARYVADGVPLSAILAVTFTRMATGELRERIRGRLMSTEAALGQAQVSGDDRAADDPVVGLLGRAARPQLEVYRHRLADAIAEFDTATIATTHSFCQLVLHGLGTAGDIPLDSTLLEDPEDLVGQVVDDLYLRWMLRHPPLPFRRSVAVEAATEAVRNPDIRIVPGHEGDASSLLARLAARAREEVGRRLAESGLLTYDQLLFRLAETLDDPARGPIACRRLRERYQVVLVDEFQDTDPIQWRVLQRAFGGGDIALILIGDPKQAIYAFRGADVYAYLEAARQAGARYTLGENWRSDQPLLDAIGALFSPLQFGHADIPFRPVEAPPGRRDPGARNLPRPEALRVRVVGQRQAGVLTTKGKQLLQKASLVEWIAGDVAADIRSLLCSGAELRDGPGGGWRPIEESDVAVLTRTNRQAAAVRDALRAHGVASVVAGMDSVFESEAASFWLRLLEALQEPTSRSRVAAVALTPFVGMTPDEAASAEEHRWEWVHELLHRWATVLAERGVAALVRAVTVEERLPARILSRPEGERLLTDLGHVGQLLHAEEVSSSLAGPALRAWLAQRIRSAAKDQSEAEERSRRLDSDAEAVQVLTVHRAKGLEFAVVYCPYMWDALQDRRSGPVVFHDPEHGDVRTLDVGSPGDDPDGKRAYLSHLEQARDEDRGEDLRALYVAVTRARHQVVVSWGRAQRCGRSPLGRLLLSRHASTGAVGAARIPEPADKLVRAALDDVVAKAPAGLVAIEAATGPDPAGGSSRTSAADAPNGLAVARFDRLLDESWQRASYTSITAAAHGSVVSTDWVATEPENGGVTDEPALAPAVPGPASAPPVGSGTQPAMASPLASVPGGREVGTFLHRVLEATDFAAANLVAEVEAAVSRVSRRGMPEGDFSGLVGGLAAVIETPLGPLAAGAALTGIGRSDRLDELAFELPVAGGDRPTGMVSTAGIARLLETHLGDGGPLAGYPERLADPVLAATFRGYLTGSLDLVFRRRDRWFVADYKSNWLGGRGGSPTVWEYRPEALAAEMLRWHYPLQALLYLVALHRYLRWRQRRYQPERHLGGVLYLFLRGMAGRGAPEVDGQPCGVFSWRPPALLIVELSDLLERGEVR